jgi:hypothetical protein
VCRPLYTFPSKKGEGKGSVTEKGKEAIDKAKGLIKKAARAVTPGGGENREYFSNLIKKTNERSIKGPYRNYFNKLIKESNARSAQSLIQEQRTAMIKDTLLMAISQAREGVGEVGDPRAQALYETTAETLQGLLTAYEHK